LIYAKRFEAGLSKITLAAKIGVTKELIREWEADQRVPTEAEWGKLKVILQLDLTVTLKSKVSEEFRV
jgi:ribosome-binding protein aMBF1 (putative translation factor)